MRQQNLGTSKDHISRRGVGIAGLIVGLKHHLCCSHVLVAWTCDLVHLSANSFAAVGCHRQIRTRIAPLLAPWPVACQQGALGQLLVPDAKAASAEL